MPKRSKRASMKCLDTSSVCDEQKWFAAEDMWPSIRSFCKAWDGARDLGMVSVFDRSCRVSRTFNKSGEATAAYDIEHDQGMDIVSESGFFLLLGLLLCLMPNSFSMWAPPCSLFIFFTSSLHERHRCGPWGNLDHYVVRLANRISINCAVALKVALKFRSDCRAMVEQPAGSWLFKSPIWIEIIAGFYLNRTLTYQGLFGGPLLKATHLLHNMPSSQFFARKLTKALKTKFQEKQRRWKHVQECFYIKGPGGTVTGTKMMSYTSLYPQRMITAIFKTWRALKKLRAGSLK